jgi:hypothetical protein
VILLHTFLGFTIAEWGGIITIAGGLIGAIYKVAVKPLKDTMGDLGDAIRDLTASSKKDHQAFDDRLDKHDQKLVRHDAEIQFLYDKNGMTRRKSDD